MTDFYFLWENQLRIRKRKYNTVGILGGRFQFFSTGESEIKTGIKAKGKEVLACDWYV